MDAKMPPVAPRDLTRAEYAVKLIEELLGFIPKPVLQHVLQGYLDNFTESPRHIKIDLRFLEKGDGNPMHCPITYKCGRSSLMPIFCRDTLTSREIVTPGDIVSVIWAVWGAQRAEFKHPRESLPNRGRAIRRTRRLVALPAEGAGVVLTDDIIAITSAMGKEGLLLGIEARKTRQNSMSLSMSFDPVRSPFDFIGKRYLGDELVDDPRISIPSKKISVLENICIPSPNCTAINAYFMLVHYADAKEATRPNAVLIRAITQRVYASAAACSYDEFIEQAIKNELTRVVFGDAFSQTSAEAESHEDRNSSLRYIDEILIVRDFQRLQHNAVDVYRVDRITETVTPHDDAKNSAVVSMFEKTRSAEQGERSAELQINIPFVLHPPELDALIWRGACRELEWVLFWGE